MSSSQSQRWAVIGGGILGMTLAHRLTQHGHKVTLIEKAEHLGGLAGAWRLGDVVWDRHYHVTLLSDAFTRALLTDLGLEHNMEWVQTRTAFFTDGAFHPMSDSLEFLKFPPLGLVGKARLAATILYASKVKNWRRLEQIPVADWLRKWSGKKTFEKIWLPLLRAKLGDNYKQTSAAFIWATIARMYAARRSGLKKEMFGYVPGGYARVLEAFRELLIDKGVSLMLGTEVQRITPGQPGKVTVETVGDQRVEFDRVVLTVPAPTALKLCPDISEDERSRLERVQYQGIVCASLLLKRPLAGYYITNITESWVPFTAVIELTTLVDREHFGGRTLVYLPKYMACDDPGFATSDAEWEDRFVGALTRMYPNFRREEVLAFQISKERLIYALPTIGYSEHRPFRRSSLPGVFFVNSAQIVNGTLNVNETIKLAEEALPDLLTRPETPPPHPLFADGSRP
jgi:protoporphyrinogen oxidase